MWRCRGIVVGTAEVRWLLLGCEGCWGWRFRGVKGIMKGDAQVRTMLQRCEGYFRGWYGGVLWRVLHRCGGWYRVV